MGRYIINKKGADIEAILNKAEELPLEKGSAENSVQQKGCTASGINSFAIGYTSEATGNNSFAEGAGAQAQGIQSHAEGGHTRAIGRQSHAEGTMTKASGENSHAEGYTTIASGENSHAEGYTTIASGENSHAEGRYTNTTNAAEHAEGQYNVTIKNKTIRTIGIGTSESERKNAEETHTNGDRYVYGIGGYDGTNSQTSGIKSVQQVITDIEAKIGDENFGGIVCLNLGNTMEEPLIEQAIGILQDITQNQKHYIVTVYDTVSKEYYGDCEVIYESSGVIRISNVKLSSALTAYAIIYSFDTTQNSYSRNLYSIKLANANKVTELESRIAELETMISQITITEE